MKRPKCGEVDWHGYTRGARRLDLFRDDEDRATILSFMKSGLKASGCGLTSFSLMSNHYHETLYGTPEQVSQCMYLVNHGYSLYHNRRYGFEGHAFDGPYKAHFQQSSYLLLCRVAYVLNNPVYAGMLRDPAEYPWCCYRSYLGQDGSPVPVDTGRILALLSPDPPTARRLFQEFVKEQAQRVKSIQPDKLTASQIQRISFEDLLAFSRTRPDACRSEDPTTIAILWARRVGVPPRVIGEALNLGPDAVYMRLERLKHRLGGSQKLLDLFPLP